VPTAIARAVRSNRKRFDMAVAEMEWRSRMLPRRTRAREVRRKSE
jgi:hypothetical protein